MARVREFREVINNSPDTYREEFRGKEIVIPAFGSIIMERREAVQFMAQYKPFDREKSNGEKPLSWKPAHGKRPAAPQPEVEAEEKIVSPVTGNEHATKESLDEELAGFAHLKLKEKED